MDREDRGRSPAPPQGPDDDLPSHLVKMIFAQKRKCSPSNYERTTEKPIPYELKSQLTRKRRGRGGGPEPTYIYGNKMKILQLPRSRLDLFWGFLKIRLLEKMSRNRRRRLPRTGNWKMRKNWRETFPFRRDLNNLKRKTSRIGAKGTVMIIQAVTQNFCIFRLYLI